MPKNGTDRAPVAERGTDLLKRINEAGDAGLMLTQEEGLDAVQAGYAVVDPSVTEGNTAKVTLTDAGRAALTSAGGGTAAKFAVESGVQMPEIASRRGRTSTYPFEALGVGDSFHVPVSNDASTPEKVAARLQSSVSGARTRFAEATGETRKATIRTYKRDDAGEFVKDAEGKRIVDTETEEDRPVMKPTRDFKVLPVTNDPKGPGARVWRTA